jgi:hypothetical protein
VPTGAEKLRKTNGGGGGKLFEAKWEWRKESEIKMSKKKNVQKREGERLVNK